MNYADIFPSVRRTDGSIQKFSSIAILDALIKETKMPQELAEDVTKKTCQLLVAMTMSFLTGPFIREVCCVAMAEMGLWKYRCKFTRVGVPLFEVHETERKLGIENVPAILGATLLRETERLDAAIAELETSEFGSENPPESFGPDKNTNESWQDRARQYDEANPE